jgi:hypothetical protein
MTIKQSAWTGMVPVDDTALYVTDTGGRGRPVHDAVERNERAADDLTHGSSPPFASVPE